MGRIRLAVALGLIAPALVACTGTSTAAANSPLQLTGGTTGTVGTLDGHLLAVGGPAPGRPTPWTGTVTITGTAFHRDITVGVDGAYSLRLVPGRYTVVGHSPRFDDGTAPCPAAHAALVTAGRTTTLDAVCQMK
jgi:hypothetical protein